MDFAALPPEINSGRIYAGPGSGSMLTAAAAWDSLARELRSTAAGYRAAISGLIADWQGPSSTAMLAAVEPYIAWLDVTAAQAEETGSRATTAAAAYQTVFEATVPPSAVASNRTLRSTLVATNVVGQNTAAIAATEAAYAQMWVQDTAAMYGYAESSSLAAQLDAFQQPSPTTHPPGSRAGANSPIHQLISTMRDVAQSAASPAAADPTGADSAAVQALGGLVSQVQAAAVVSVISGLGITAGNLSATLDAATATGAVSATPALAVGAPAFASAGGPRIVAEAGAAHSVGPLSVPPNWAAATPTVRLAAAALSGGGAYTGPAIVTAGLESAIAQTALASVAGNARGSTTVADVRGAAEQRRPVSEDDSDTSEKLKRVLSQLAHEPDSVQHWHTDKAHLDGLLEQLSNRPGIHTVHVSKKPRFTTKPPGPF